MARPSLREFSIQAWIASCALATAPSGVSPLLTQPGRSGTIAANPPPSATDRGSTRIGYSRSPISPPLANAPYRAWASFGCQQEQHCSIPRPCESCPCRRGRRKRPPFAHKPYRMVIEGLSPIAKLPDAPVRPRLQTLSARAPADRAGRPGRRSCKSALRASCFLPRRRPWPISGKSRAARKKGKWARIA